MGIAKKESVSLFTMMSITIGGSVTIMKDHPDTK